MTCVFTMRPCPYVGIGKGCMGNGCPELDYLYNTTDEEMEEEEEHLWQRYTK